MPDICKVYCDYCEHPATLVPDTAVYQRGYGGNVWFCKPCDAWVGVHKNSKRFAPLGRLAKADLRKLKMQAHRLFDPLWKAKMEREGIPQSEARQAAYHWLAHEMQEKKEHACHIGFMNEEQCQKVIDLCERYYK